MPAAGRADSKYVRKVHFTYSTSGHQGHVTTRCGKRVLARHTTRDPREVTCKTCLLILDIPVGGLEG